MRTGHLTFLLVGSEFHGHVLARRSTWFHRVNKPLRLLCNPFGPQHSGKNTNGSPGAIFAGRISQARPHIGRPGVRSREREVQAHRSISTLLGAAAWHARCPRWFVVGGNARTSPRRAVRPSAPHPTNARKRAPARPAAFYHRRRGRHGAALHGAPLTAEHPLRLRARDGILRPSMDCCQNSKWARHRKATRLVRKECWR